MKVTSLQAKVLNGGFVIPIELPPANALMPSLRVPTGNQFRIVYVPPDLRIQLMTLTPDQIQDVYVQFFKDFLPSFGDRGTRCTNLRGFIRTLSS